ncbi:MAG: hypothetical protein ACP5H2_09830 [Solirubrobacteraceae bacterium]
MRAADHVSSFALLSRTQQRTYPLASVGFPSQRAGCGADGLENGPRSRGETAPAGGHRLCGGTLVVFDRIHKSRLIIIAVAVDDGNLATVMALDGDTYGRAGGTCRYAWLAAGAGSCKV